jgi:hypothetical protein
MRSPSEKSFLVVKQCVSGIWDHLG